MDYSQYFETNIVFHAYHIVIDKLEKVIVLYSCNCK